MTIKLTIECHFITGELQSVQRTLTPILLDFYPVPPDLCGAAWNIVFKRNANAFSLNAIVDVRLRRHRHEMTFLNISETTRASYFKSYHIVFTFRPEMTSLTTSGRQHIIQTLKFWVMFGSRFLDDGSTDSEKKGLWFGKLRFKGFISSCAFLLLNQENGAQVGLPASTWLILICSKTANASSFKS